MPNSVEEVLKYPSLKKNSSWSEFSSTHTRMSNLRLNIKRGRSIYFCMIKVLCLILLAALPSFFALLGEAYVFYVCKIWSISPSLSGIGSCIVGVTCSACSSISFVSSGSFAAYFFFILTSSFPEQYYLISFMRESISLNTWMPLPLFRCVGFKSHKLKESKWHIGIEYRVWVLFSKLKVLNFVTALCMDLGSYTVAPVTLSSL